MTVRSEVLTLHGSLAHDAAPTVLCGCHARRDACWPPGSPGAAAGPGAVPPNDGGSRLPAASAAHQKNTADQRTRGIPRRGAAPWRVCHRPSQRELIRDEKNGFECTRW